ncbi:uncharacterized protein LOC117814146 [Xyrichtys novacula]|uniref:Uncharacterized protein LOC117814146 n=1 Tax=Xyrichtys novacula TaxID=13765 RepID=A0AAV1F9D0_XYRNO|nr:uncharacterized protein LOC117814146 [Xyrichtys novacula]
MGHKILITRLILVFLLRELNYSSAFPRGRSSMYPKSLQREGVKQQERYGYGNRRPLQYIRALRQANKTQSISEDQVKPSEIPEENSLMARSFAPIQNQAHLSYQTQNLHQPWSEETSPLTQQNGRSLFEPRSFELNLKLPFANLPNPSKDKDLQTKGAGLSSEVKDGQLYRPTGVQIFSSFNSPSGSDDVSGKGSTKNPNGGESPHEVSMPSFLFSLSVPITPPTPSLKPSSDEVGYLENSQSPEYMEPNFQPSSVYGESDWVLLNHANSVQQQTGYSPSQPLHTNPIDSKLVTFLPEPNKLSSLSEPISQSALPTLQYPQQPDNIFGDYHNSQIKSTQYDHGSSQIGQIPTLDTAQGLLSPLQYESFSSGHYSISQIPSGNNHAQPQTLQTVTLQPTFPSEQYSYSQLETSLEQAVQTSRPNLVHSSSPMVEQSHYNIPSSGYHAMEAATSNYYGKGNMEPVGQTDYSYQYSIGHSGQEVLPKIPTTLDHTNYQAPIPIYQTQTGAPGQYNGRKQLVDKPNYTKLLIHVEDVAEQNGGQHESFTAPTPNYYSGKKTVEPLNSNPPPYMSVYHQTPGMEGGVGQYSANPQQLQLEMDQAQASYALHGQMNYAPGVGVNAGAVQTNLGQQDPVYHTMQDVYNPSTGQYSTNQ